MPWAERKVSQMREEFVKRVLAGEASKSALCREYGISRPTGDKWIKRYEAGDTLENRSRAPQNRPRETATEMEKKIVAYRQAHPAIGATKLRRILENQGCQNVPSHSTINRIFAKNGLITKEASLAATPHQRFEKSEPNEMWQADYKGHFAMKNGQRCHPLNIIDDYSRFNLCCQAQLTETFEEIRPVMVRLFQEYGMPFSLLCDNGNPWGTAQSVGFSRFEVWLMELGILTLHGRALHPQTQGKEESFNRSMTKELLKHTTISDQPDAQRQFDAYRDFYNNERPHHALSLDTPSQRYTPSPRAYPKRIRPWEYPPDRELRRVKETGYFNHGGQGYFLSEAFAGKDIAVYPSHIRGCITLQFRQFKIGRIDLERRVFTFKRAFLIEGDPRMSHSRVGVQN